ncbi:GNAT family N-acetyltransferase [Roseateles chitinivorans]|uniref:GNAT family N-acetyltransferase n=1 Tax=Roseateles chitinivorans TaxID=2917965 RepID=UPI003D66434B
MNIAPTSPVPTPSDDSLLDHVVWHALTGRQAVLAAGEADAWRFASDVGPFGALRPSTIGTPAQLTGLLRIGSPVVLVVAEDDRPFGGLVPFRRAPVDQMVLVDPSAMASVPDIGTLTMDTADVPDILELVRATQPGPFGQRTLELGRYLGVRLEGRLVALSGERMKVPGFTEVSAVCVDPSCRGRGFAASLMKAVAQGILARGETPFLHVFTDNLSAIALYERLGFRLRRRFSVNFFDERAFSTADAPDAPHALSAPSDPSGTPRPTAPS